MSTAFDFIIEDVNDDGTIDVYDQQHAFDDIWTAQDGEPVPTIDVLGGAVAALRRQRIASPMAFSPRGTASSGPLRGVFSLFDSIRGGFEAALPTPVAARVDDADSYRAFRGALSSLEDRVTAIEALVRQHVADNHGGGRVAALEEALAQHLREAQAGIVLGSHRGADCWEDGGNLAVTLRLPNGRFATVSAPVDRYVRPAIGICGEDVYSIPRFAFVIGANELAHAAASYGHALAEIGCPIIGVLSPTADAGLAAAMTLWQRCQQGDQRACAEVRRMQIGGCDALLGDAKKRLLKGQREKAKRLRRGFWS